MPKKRVGPRPREDPQEVATAIIRAGVGSVPLVGAAGGELLAVLAEHVIPSRKDAWLDDLGEIVNDLRDHALDIRDLAGNEAFWTIFIAASEAALRTHEADKRRALRNALTRSALAIGPDEHMQLMFVRFLDEFTALHLQLLTLLRDPRAWFKRFDLPPLTHSGSRTLVVEGAFPELRGRPTFYSQVVSELSARGLLSGSVAGMVSEEGMWQGITSELGNQFLDFIADIPPAPAQNKEG